MTTPLDQSRAQGLRLRVTRPRRKRAAFRAAGLLVAAALLVLALAILLWTPGAREAAQKNGAGPGIEDVQTGDTRPQRP
jgi:hypothetical protein